MGCEEKLNLENVQSIKGIFKTLEVAGLHPVRFKNKETDCFSRCIKFYIGTVPFWIEWWVNGCYLSIGGRYTTYIRFTSVVTDATWPCFKRGLKFFQENMVVCRVSVENLDWQDRRLNER